MLCVKLDLLNVEEVLYLLQEVFMILELKERKKVKKCYTQNMSFKDGAVICQIAEQISWIPLNY